jgi:hypothetical protein
LFFLSQISFGVSCPFDKTIESLGKALDFFGNFIKQKKGGKPLFLSNSQVKNCPKLPNPPKQISALLPFSKPKKNPQQTQIPTKNQKKKRISGRSLEKKEFLTFVELN